ncbi:MAG TPA: hypothetical protein VLS27_02860 [Gammaproteobacteria bacterium]|nr:hypothetical protein [Gammaproteobacteria bacterium]
MDTRFPAPDAVLSAAAPAAAQQPAVAPVPPRRTFDRISDNINGVLFYSLVAFGILFPVVATIYALIVY